MGYHECWLLVLTCLALATLTRTGFAQNTCQVKLDSYSPYFGPAPTNEVKAIDQTPRVANGRITRLVVYYQTSCVVGFKARYGTDPKNTFPLGTSTASGAKNVTVIMATAEYINKIVVRASSKCVELITIHTTGDRTIQVGNTASTATTKTTQPKSADGFLLALRGSESLPIDGNKGKVKQLGFVWGTKTCTAPPSSPKPAPYVSCPAVKAQCDAAAQSVEFNACSYVSPFTSSKCWGGCCMSAGKCASTSCAISGLGRDVSSLICYGVNTGVSVGGVNMCNGLGCKLAVPGCTTDSFGGNCVGRVAATGAVEDVDPEAAKYLGYPCLDATPSDVTLNSKGDVASKGYWVAKLWTICDCANPVLPSSPSGGDDDSSLSLFNLGGFFKGLLNKTDADKNDVLEVISKLLPALPEDAPVNFDSLIPQLNLSALLKLPEVPKIVVPQFNITLPGGLLGSGDAPDLNTILSFLNSDKLTGVATVLKGLGKNEASHPLTALGALLETISAKGDFWGSLKNFFQVLPSDVATPTGLKKFLTALTTSSDGTASPLQGVVDFLKALPLPGSSASSTSSTSSDSSSSGNLITDLVSSLPGATGSDNKLAGLLNILSAIPSGNGTTGSPLQGLTSLLSALPSASGVSDASALSKLGSLLSLIPNADGSDKTNALTGLGALLQSLPLKDAEGNNPLGPLGSLVATVGSLVPSDADASSSNGGALLSNLLSLVTSLSSGRDTTAADDASSSSNPLMSLLQSIGDGSSNPLLAVLQKLPSADSVTAADGSGVLGTLVGQIVTNLAGSASAADEVVSSNPLAGFLLGLTSLAAPAEEDSTNPLTTIMSSVMASLASAGSGSSSTTATNPLVSGVLKVVGQTAASSSNPLVSLLGGLVSKIGS